MRLSFQTGYEDYEDLEQLLPCIDQLKQGVERLSYEAAVSLDHDDLLNVMEDIDELLRYYAVTENFGQLEQYMRRQDQFLNLCSQRQYNEVGYLFLNMSFLRLNALLYKGNHQNRQAAEYYRRFLDVSEMCFRQLQTETKLDREQVLYVGWACVDGMKEAVRVFDADPNSPSDPQILYQILSILEWLEPYMQDAAGICEQTAELYAFAGGGLFAAGDHKTSTKCFQRSVEIFCQLDRRYDSDFYAARSIWVHSMFALQCYMTNGDLQEMLRCQKDAENYLGYRRAEKRDQGIVLGAQGMILLQKGCLLQQNEQLAEAICQSEKACDNLETSLQILEEAYQGRAGYYKMVLSNIAGQVFSNLIGAVETIGVQYYYHEDWELAKNAFEKALTLLTDENKYQVGSSGALVVRAECCQYLALLASNAGDPDQTVFYGVQAVDFSTEAAQQTGNPAAWGITVISCTMLSEFYLSQKNKLKAGEYADRGISACNTLGKLLPQASQLQMMPLLEKYRKRASRKLF